MAKRLTDTDIWDKEWFMNLPPKLKCLVKFVRDKCDLAGVWSPNWALACTYIGDKVTEQELVSIDEGKQFVKLESGKIFCVDFIQFQNGTLSDKSPIHIKILSLLKSHNIPYPYPIHRVLNRGVVVVGVKEVVKERVKVGEEKSLEELVFPFESEGFKNAWNILHGQKKWKKKGFDALQASLKKLGNYTEATAINIIEDCIAGEWQGLVTDKYDKQNGKQQQQGNQLGSLEAEADRILRGES